MKLEVRNLSKSYGKKEVLKEIEEIYLQTKVCGHRLHSLCVKINFPPLVGSFSQRP